MHVVGVCRDVGILVCVCVTECGNKVIKVYITVINSGVNLVCVVASGGVMKCVVQDKCARCMVCVM